MAIPSQLKVTSRYQRLRDITGTQALTTKVTLKNVGNKLIKLIGTIKGVKV